MPSYDRIDRRYAGNTLWAETGIQSIAATADIHASIAEQRCFWGCPIWRPGATIENRNPQTFLLRRQGQSPDGGRVRAWSNRPNGH